MITVVVPGTPIAKKRPRFAVRGGKGHVYSDQETEEGKLLWELRQQFKGEPLEGALQVQITFYFVPLKGDKAKVRAAKLNGEEGHTKKPDVDNLIKFYFDVMNGLIWVDDSQVVAVFGEKRFAEQARTEIIIKRMGECDLEATQTAEAELACASDF